jgi:predicted ATPase
VTDLGEHRLKDIEGTLSIFQLGAVPFPPLKTISNTNLPRPANSFIGRENEVGGIVSLLRGDARLLTLTGPGGSGKTRLAVEAAAELVPEFKAGVFWVDLAPIRDPGLVTAAIARSLGAKGRLVDHIGERELLLLLDNLEQVVDAAPEVAGIVESCPRLKVLVTSRELLRVRGEVEYPVLPLAQPEAVELFCARARVEPDESIQNLCRSLDNLPLAIELAAARAQVLSPTQILGRLSQRLDLLKGGRDAQARQLTLRATIEWSHDLLSPEERTLFARLSVFAGGCSLEDAEAVAGADLDTLESLVDKNLVLKREDQFSMLETIHQFAAERLEESGTAQELRGVHAAHFLALAKEAEPHLRGSPKEWLDRLESEHDNFRAALDWLEASGDIQLALRLAGAVWRFWAMRGHMAEGVRRLESLLGKDKHPTTSRAESLSGATVMRVDGGGDLGLAMLQAEEALAIYRAQGDAWGIAHSLFLLGATANETADFPRAKPPLEDGLRRFRELGDEHYALLTAMQLAWTYAELGDDQHARALEEEGLRQSRATGNQRMEARFLDSLALHARREGRIRDALLMQAASIRTFRELGDLNSTADSVSRFAITLAVDGRAANATRLLSKSLALYQELGEKVPHYVARRNEETLSRIRAVLDEDAFSGAMEEGRTLTVDDAVAIALDSPTVHVTGPGLP